MFPAANLHKIMLRIHQFFPNITLSWKYLLYSPRCCYVLVLQKTSSHMECPHPGINDSLFCSVFLAVCALVKGCFPPPPNSRRKCSRLISISLLKVTRNISNIIAIAFHNITIIHFVYIFFNIDLLLCIHE